MTDEHEKLYEMLPGVNQIQRSLDDMVLVVKSAESYARLHDKIVNVREKKMLQGCSVTIRCKGNYSDFAAGIPPAVQEQIIEIVLKYYQSQVAEGVEEIQRLKEQL